MARSRIMLGVLYNSTLPIMLAFYLINCLSNITIRKIIIQCYGILGYGSGISEWYCKRRNDIICDCVQYFETFLSLWIFDEIHSTLCRWITHIKMDKLRLREWKCLKNWQQTVEQCEISGFVNFWFRSIATHSVCGMNYESVWNQGLHCKLLYENKPYYFRSTFGYSVLVVVFRKLLSFYYQ